jgi:hypothetical protein
MATPPSFIHGLEREDRATKLRTYSKYVMVILALLMFLMVLDAIRRSGVSITPFYLPLGSFLFIILYFLLLANVVVIAVDTIELNLITDLRNKVWKAEDFMANARPLAVVTLVLAILFSSQAIPGLISDFGSSKGSESLEPLGAYRLRFFPTDPLEFSRIDKAEVTCERGTVRVIVIEEKDFEVLDDAGYNLSDPAVYRLVKWAGAGDGASITSDLGPLSLPYAEYSLVIHNPTNDTVSMSYRLQNEASAPFLSNMLVLCVFFFALNLAWAISLYAVKRKYVGDFVKKEQQRLMRTYTIEEVFLIYKDGRLICHNTRRLKPDLDKDVLTGMLTAVQSFVKDSFAGEEKGVLNELKYGNLKVVMENGPRANLAVVISGVEPASLRATMRAMLATLHQRYMPVLEDWDGDTGTLKDLKKQIGQLVPEERLRERTEVEEIMLIYRDNRFMMHLSQRGQPDVDDTLLNQLVDTVKEKVGQNLATMSSNPMYEIPYGTWKVVLEYGVQIYMAVLISGSEPPDLRGRMRTVLDQLSISFEGILLNWDGNTQKLLDLKPVIETLFVESLKKTKGKKK